MNPDRWRELDQLFEAALERTGEARASFLAEVEPELRAELEQLLAADRSARTFLERNSWLAATAPRDPPGLAGESTERDRTRRSRAPGGPELPKRIGPYKVLGVLGEGGMGRVLLASRADEQYQRLVAIKTLRARRPEVPRPGARGADTLRERRLRQELLARFDLERQALAQLEHPNIARLYDAGRDEGGDPYLVLEHIDGVPLDAYCDHHRLDVAARLRLFLEVCGAVQVAHKNLLVHRDIKPGNILVTAEGRPMLLDFGIAKLLDPGRIAGELLETREGSRPMTPGYASPEQVKGEPITTASDVYSLGVLLYELLTGREPYRVTSWLPHELERAICEVEPERPSTAIFRETGSGEGRTGERPLAAGEVARRRATSPGALARHLRGDLDTLLQKALRKDPERRYASVEAMAQDIHAYLEGRPLAARPASAFYALHKFARRHRFGVAAAAALAALLAAFLAALAFQAREIRVEGDKAQQALAFLIEVFKASDPARAEGEQLTAREVLDGAARRIETELAAQPEIQATLMVAMGQVYQGLGHFPQADELFAKSTSRGGELGPSHPLALAARLGRGRARLGMGDYSGARSHFAAAVAGLEAAGGSPAELAKARLGLGDALHELGQAREAIVQKEAAVGLLEAAAASSPAAGDRSLEAELAGAELSFGASLMLVGQAGRAEPLYASAERRRRRLFGDRSLETAEALFRRGELARVQGSYREAVAFLKEAIDLQRRLLDAEHPKLLSSLQNLAICLAYVGPAQDAVPIYREILEKRRRRLGPRHADVAWALSSLGSNLELTGKKSDALEALGAFEEALEIRRATFGGRHALVAESLGSRARILHQLGRLDEAAGDCRAALEIQRSLENAATEVERGYVCLARVALARRDFAAAADHLGPVYTARKERLPPQAEALVDTEIDYGCALGGLERHAEAEPLLRAAYATLVRRNPHSTRAGKVLGCLAPVAEALGRPDAGKMRRILANSELWGTL